MSADNRINRFPKDKWPLAAVIATTLLAVGVSLYFLRTGRFIIFQNLFYFPIIIACVYYLKRGFAFSAGLALLYFILVSVHTDNFIIIAEALVRFVIFILIAGIMTFISLRLKRMNEKFLRDTEEWEDAFDAVPDLVAVIDNNFRIVKANRAMAERLHLTQEACVGEICYRLMHGTEEPPALCPHLKTLADGKEHRAAVSEGRIGGDFIISTSPLTGTNGKMDACVHVARDITDFRRVEDALRKSEERYRLTFASITDVVYMLDNTFKVLSVSPSVENAMGYKPEELIGRPFPDLNILSPESLKLAAEDSARVLSGGPIAVSVYEFIAKDGTRKFGEVSGAPVYQEGRIIGLISVARDITERKRDQKALRQSEEKYKLTFTHITDVVYMLDRDLKFLTVSPSAEGLVGYKPEELIGRPFADFNFLPPESRQTALSDVRRAFSGETVIGSVYEFITRDKTRKFVEVNSAPLYQEGRVAGMISIARDITQRKQAEANLIREKNQLNRLLSLHQIPDTQTEDIESFIVEECIGITDSRLGFFGFINEEETVMTAHLWSSEAMKGCLMDQKPVEFSLDHAGIWAEAVREHRAVVINDYSNPDPRKKGYPEGHVHIARLMSIPLIRNGKAVAIVAVANKQQDYDDTDLLHISLLLENVWGIFQRKRAEDALKHKEAYFRSLIENSSDMITIVDEKGIIVYESPSIKRVLGYEPSEVIGRSAFDFSWPEDMNEIRASFGRAISKHGNPLPGIQRYLHKDGSWRYLESIDQNMLEDKEVRGLVVNSHDVTARVKAEDALRKSEARLNTLVHNIPDLVWLKDFDGLYLACNPAFERFFGAKESDIVGKTDYDFVEKELADSFRDNDCNAMEAGGPSVNEEWITFAADGHRALLETIKTPMYDWRGALVGVLGIGRDITERKQMEEALRDRNRELNTLYSIAGVIEKTETTDEALEQSVGHIVQGFYYPEHASARISIGNQEFRTDNYQETPWKMSVDIISGGNPVGRVEVCYLKELPQKDEGPFFKEERILLNSIAQRFSKYYERNKYEMEREILISELQSALSEIKQLSGLLPICSSCKKVRNDDGYWEQIEGYIRDHSEVEFSHGICPDCAKKLTPDGGGEPGRPKTAKKIKVLLVDDEENFRILFIRQTRRIVKNIDADFIEARDAREALTLLKRGLKPSVIVVDYVLGKDNGIELLRKIDANNPELRDVPRIVMSGYKKEYIESESRDLRFVFFEKGSDMEMFCGEIWKYIETLPGIARE